MANNPYVNKVQLADGTTLMDISDTTASAGEVLSGHVFYTASGTRSSGSLNINGKADKVQNATSGNFAGLDSNGNLTDSGSKASDFAASSTALSLTLASGSWSSATPPTQSVTATGVTASNNIIVGIDSTATAAEYAAIMQAQLLCTAQASNSITITCYGTKPTVNIPISVAILG